MYILMTKNTQISNPKHILGEGVLLCGIMVALFCRVYWEIWLHFAMKVKGIADDGNTKFKNIILTLNSKQIKSLVYFVGCSIALSYVLSLFFAYEALRLVL